MSSYPWYSIEESEEPVLQGDFLRSCPIVIPRTETTPESDNIEIDFTEYDVIIMSQSCDLAQHKLDLVLVCPFWSLEEFGQQNSYFKGPEGREKLRQGQVLGYHLLNRCEIEGFQTDYLVVDFRNVYGVPINFLFNLVPKQGRRLRLLPPYREHLSQAFARFFMRVGLPVDIPRFARK